MLTAGHCVCSYADTNPNAKYFCKENQRHNTPINQQTDQNVEPLNYIYVKVGNQDNSIGRTMIVELAYAMNTYLDNKLQMAIGEHYDIGMIITQHSMTIPRTRGMPVAMMLPEE